jgi:hypothetical protein
MLFPKRGIGLALLVGAPSVFLFGQQGQQQNKQMPERDTQSIGILNRVIQAAGGQQALVAVHDISEVGEISFNLGDKIRGPVTIKMMDGNCFRMEADLPEGKRTWIAKAGIGSLKEPQGQVHGIPGNNAINLENLTYPIAHVEAALADSTTNISLIGTENEGDRSIYRIRVNGELGLSGTRKAPHFAVVKDVMVDAGTFHILRVEDRPFETYGQGGKPSDKPSRVIEFGDYRKIDGVLVPFSITTKLMGQRTMNIQLSEVLLNRSLGEQDFQN